MKILVTGTDGYIGSRLAPTLHARGDEVIGLDTGYYANGWLYSDIARLSPQPFTLVKDLRNVTPGDLEGLDAVVHLAELSNDPLGDNNPKVTYAINHEGSIRLANLAKESGVRKFVYASSCSVYGVGDGGFLDESSTTNPQTAYAKCKVKVEADILPLASNDFSVTCLRNATAYGPSPRMRFDIVINDLCALAWTTKEIAMTSDGTPWRPVVHIEDICQAICCALDAPAEKVSGEVFNVGANSENYRVRELAELIAEECAGCSFSTGAPSGDNRSYRVSFDKISSGLPGFECRWTARRGIQELLDLFARIDLTHGDFSYRAYKRLKQLKYLIRTDQIDDEFFWKTDAL